MSDWISVNDRLPFEFEDMKTKYETMTVIVCTRFGDVFADEFKRGKGVYGKGAWYKFSCSDADGYITHWMPFPEPPEDA